jgi:hypothetical protein
MHRTITKSNKRVPDLRGTARHWVCDQHMHSYEQDQCLHKSDYTCVTDRQACADIGASNIS